MVGLLRDFSEAQARLFLAVNRFLLGYEPPDLHRVIDEDVEAAAKALASTYETAAKGVIYEHQASSVPADRLTRALKPFLGEFSEKSKRTSDLECAAVLHRLAEAIEQERQELPGQPHAYLSFVERVLHDPANRETRDQGVTGGQSAGQDTAGPRLILP